MIEHQPWIGPLYETEGVRGQRLAIVGYSPYVPNDSEGRVFNDSPLHTVVDIQNVIGGNRTRFFTDIARFFGQPPPDFYRRVIMFDLVPRAIGTRDQAFSTASTELIEAGRRRTLRIAREHEVDKVIFFTQKGWKSMMPTLECVSGKRPLLRDTSFEYGHYDLGDRTILAAGLRHPLYARFGLMQHAVSEAMALPIQREINLASPG